MRKLIILGGGTAGTIVANKLRAKYPLSELQITVVDRDDAHHYQPGYLFLPFGQLAPGQIVRSRHAFIPDGVDLVLSDIERVDAASKQVFLGDGRVLDYDTLIIATGVQPRPEATPGGDGPQAGVSVHHFYDLDGAERLQEAMRTFQGGRLVVHITEMPIKCPVAPLEFTFLADAYFRDKKMRKKVEIVYVTPLDGAFTKPIASRELGDALAKRHVALETDFAVAEIDNDAKELVSFDSRRIPFDLLVTVPLNMGPDYIAASGLGDEMNLVPCDQGTMRCLAHPDIFVLGDGGTLKTSKAGSVAHFAVDIFMENWPQYLAGAQLTHNFDGHANCFIESGDGKGMLLDFNYGTQPYTGEFPLPGVGPMSLLKETKANHWAKVAFRWVYWNLLITGKPLPFTADMYLMGKHVEGEASGTATKDLLLGLLGRAAKAPAQLKDAAPREKAAGGAAVRPAAKAPGPKVSARASAAFETAPDYVPGKGLSSDADPATVLDDPIIPKF